MPNGVLPNAQKSSSVAGQVTPSADHLLKKLRLAIEKLTRALEIPTYLQRLIRQYNIDLFAIAEIRSR